MQTPREKFQGLLRKLFQFDCAELDFGIYRIMNHKRAAIHAMKETLAVLERDGSTEAIDDRLATVKERDRVGELADWQELDGRYVKPADGKK
jgi:2-methylisocitrate lyase-like PEP mutase family enzyme